MSQSLQMKIRGLYTFPNDMSAVPEGALSVAYNIVIDKDSIGALILVVQKMSFIDNNDVLVTQ